MEQYHSLLQHVLDQGRVKTDRTGTGTVSVFGAQTRYDLKGQIPAVTTKKIFFKGVVHELLWMIRGESNAKSLQREGVNIWNEWADESGELGPIYGKMWRSFPIAVPFGAGNAQRWVVDQLQAVIDELKSNPDSRRLVVSAWHPALLPDSRYTPSENASMGKQALPPCHTIFQFNTTPMTLDERVSWFNENVGTPLLVIGGNETAEQACDRNNVPKHLLSCQLYQRSADLFLGVPFNILSYSILTYMVAKITNTVPDEFIHSLGDAHIYSNHIEQVEKQLKRSHKKAPTLSFAAHCDDYTSIDQFTYDDIAIEGYESHAAIKGKVAV